MIYGIKSQKDDVVRKLVVQENLDRCIGIFSTMMWRKIRRDAESVLTMREASEDTRQRAKQLLELMQQLRDATGNEESGG